MFGQISAVMTMIEVFFVWYICEKVFQHQYEFDEIGMAQCLKFFTVTLCLEENNENINSAA